MSLQTKPRPDHANMVQDMQVSFFSVVCVGEGGNGEYPARSPAASLARK